MFRCGEVEAGAAYRELTVEEAAEEVVLIRRDGSLFLPSALLKPSLLEQGALED